jgi:GTP-binding protein EngB required for normal cell division
MAGLNENHKRKLLASLQYADRLLQESLGVLTPVSRLLFSRYLPDISPAEQHWIENYADKIREQLAALLRRFDAPPSPPSLLTSWAIRTNLISLSIALEELDPDGLHGYGELDPESARELAWSVGEVRRLVNQLLTFLSTSRNRHQRLVAGAGLDTRPARLVDEFAQIIARYGLVEFLPTLDSIIRKVESHRFEIAVFGRVSSGKSSLINRLLGIRLLPVGTTPVTTVPVHVLQGPEPKMRVHFVGKVQELPAEQLPDFATEQRNPSNVKRVVRIEVSIPSDRLHPGVAFVDTPGIASLATSGTRLSYAYLPDSDLGLVLVDGHSALGPEDLDLVRALHLSGIPSVVLISKCDLLSDEDVALVCEYTRSSLSNHLGFTSEVVPVSSADSWADRLDRWFRQFVSPMLEKSREFLAKSLDLKLQSLRDSLQVTLETRFQREGGGGAEIKQLLRPIDENLAGFRARWQGEFDDLSSWGDEIMGQAASRMAAMVAESAGEPGVPASLFQQTVLDVINSHCSTFLEEYEQIIASIGRALANLGANSAPAGWS